LSHCALGTCAFDAIRTSGVRNPFGDVRDKLLRLRSGLLLRFSLREFARSLRSGAAGAFLIKVLNFAGAAGGRDGVSYCVVRIAYCVLRRRSGDG